MEAIDSIYDLDDTIIISNSTKKEDYFKVNSITGTDWNSNGTKSFEINNQQTYLNIADSFLLCKFKFTKAANNTNATLVNDFFWKMFDSVRLYIGTQEVEAVDYVAATSEMMKFTLYSFSGRMGKGAVEGFIPDMSTGTNTDPGYNQRKAMYNDDTKAENSFTVAVPLKGIFGFCDYDKVLYGLKIRFQLQRNDNVNRLLFGAQNAFGDNNKFVINDLCWYISEYTPNLKTEEMLNRRLNSKKPLNVSYLKRRCQHVKLEHTAYTWNLGVLEGKPRYLWLIFKKPDGDEGTDKNNALCDNAKVKQLRVSLDGTFYPRDRLEIDWGKNDYGEAYKSYQKVCESNGNNDPILDMVAFQKLYTIYSIDLSSQKETIKSNRVDTSLYIERGENEEVDAYCLLLEETELQINTDNGVMINIT